MSVATMAESKYTQTAVYWGNPQNDGYGQKTYDAPVEVLCRWEGKGQAVKSWDTKGVEYQYIGIIYTAIDLQEEGCVFLGTIAQLSTEALTDPLAQEGAFQIKQFEKLPLLGSTTQFIRRSFLSPWQYR